MTIREAVEKAKNGYGWPKIPDLIPVSVFVGFVNNEGKEDETFFDLYDSDKVAELEELWDSMYKEMESGIDSVIYVEMAVD